MVYESRGSRRGEVVQEDCEVVKVDVVVLVEVEGVAAPGAHGRSFGKAGAGEAIPERGRGMQVNVTLPGTPADAPS